MGRPLHILIIDDDQDDTDFLTEAFSSRLPLTRFTTVQTGQSALDLLSRVTDAEDCPDVAFLDLHMPGKNGHQVLAELRAVEQSQHLPVMVISTSLMPDEAEKCLRAGCVAYFSKPMSLQEYDGIVQATTDYFKFKGS